MGNLNQRLERLEGGRRVRERPVILIVQPGETKEEALQKYRAQPSENEKGEVRIIINLSGQDQGPPSAPPPPRPEPKYNGKPVGPDPLRIIR